VAQFDSDDEVDHDDGFREMDIFCLQCKGRPWTMNLFVRTMQSQNFLEKINALSALKSAMESLCIALPEPPIIDLPPPYDATRIALTHRQGSVVSDMPNGNFTPQWAAWKHTQAPIMEQFAPIVPEVKALPCEGSYVYLAPASMEMQALVSSCGIPCFRIFNDSSEKCRQLALQCTILACLYTVDLGKHLPFLMSAIKSRYPKTSFDRDMKIFIGDVDSYDGYKRGSAEERQDRMMLLSHGGMFKIIEHSEECRLLLCKILSSIIRGHLFRGSIGVLSPYISDFIFTVQSSLCDPVTEVKIYSCVLLVQILRIPQWESAAKAFATALALVALGNMRHRNAKVRIAALELFQTSVSVPDRDKIKGAGTEAILDLVGFREENLRYLMFFFYLIGCISFPS
jgi:hypothetical protein